MVLAVSIIRLLLCCISTLRVSIFNYKVCGCFACMSASVPLAHPMHVIWSLIPGTALMKLWVTMWVFAIELLAIGSPLQPFFSVERMVKCIKTNCSYWNGHKDLVLYSMYILPVLICMGWTILKSLGGNPLDPEDLLYNMMLSSVYWEFLHCSSDTGQKYFV